MPVLKNSSISKIDGSKSEILEETIEQSEAMYMHSQVHKWSAMLMTNGDTPSEDWDWLKDLRELLRIVKPELENDFIEAIKNYVNSKQQQEIELNYGKLMNICTASQIPEELVGIIFIPEVHAISFVSAAKLSKGNMTVLLHDETCYGRKLLAKFIHSQSNRADKPFVVFDAAINSKKEDFQQLLLGVEGGTLFVDEIEKIDLSLQALLIHFLDADVNNGSWVASVRNTDIRFIFGTDTELDIMVGNGKFLKELYWKIQHPCLHSVPFKKWSKIRYFSSLMVQRYTNNGLNVPENINEIVSDLTKKICAQTDNLKMWDEYDWPGDQREFTQYFNTAIVTENWSEYFQNKTKNGFADITEKQISPEPKNVTNLNRTETECNGIGGEEGVLNQCLDHAGTPRYVENGFNPFPENFNDEGLNIQFESVVNMLVKSTCKKDINLFCEGMHLLFQLDTGYKKWVTKQNGEPEDSIFYCLRDSLNIFLGASLWIHNEWDKQDNAKAKDNQKIGVIARASDIEQLPENPWLPLHTIEDTFKIGDRKFEGLSPVQLWSRVFKEYLDIKLPNGNNPLANLLYDRDVNSKIFADLTVLGNAISSKKSEILRFTWLAEESKLKKLYCKLKQDQFIEAHEDVFLSKFENKNGKEMAQNMHDKIKWIKSDAVIAHFYAILKENKFVSDFKLWVTIQKSFIRRDGTTFDNRQLARDASKSPDKKHVALYSFIETL